MVSEYVRTAYSACIGVEYFGETNFCDVVRFHYAVVVIDATL